MRLIDEHNTIVAVERILEKYGFTRECTVTDEIHDAIENVPTVYDVDKVVEELKQRSKEYNSGVRLHGKPEEMLTDDAIEIVKQGGVGKDVE